MAEIYGDLGLRPRELGVIRMCLWALEQVPNGHYLCSPGQVASARRLIERGFLTDVTDQAGLVGPNVDGWLVVKLTQENINAMKAEPAKPKA